ncbi:MAG: hypothetical protein IKI09_02435 [Bacteroidales bacterium]|nr:hypothetical protein [Bacteroidales bacterium]
MKKTRLLILTLAIIASASVSMAQTLVTSTQASTTVILPKSDRVKGLVIRPEVGVGTELPDIILGANGIVAYQFNPYIAVGGGVGLEVFGDVWTSWFGNFRVYFSDTYVSPYIDLKLGSQSKDFMGSAMLGIQCKCFDYGASIKYWDYRYGEWILALHFAYNIQLGKKNK